jgi:hypothetical protein
MNPAESGRGGRGKEQEKSACCMRVKSRGRERSLTWSMERKRKRGELEFCRPCTAANHAPGPSISIHAVSISRIASCISANGKEEREETQYIEEQSETVTGCVR